MQVQKMIISGVDIEDLLQRQELTLWGGEFEPAVPTSASDLKWLIPDDSMKSGEYASRNHHSAVASPPSDCTFSQTTE
jgi:hypothetical protein